MHRDDGTELVSIKKRIPTMNYLLAKDISETSRHCSVDAPIHFLKNSTAVSGSDPIGTKVFGKSPIDPKYTSNRHVHLNQIPVCLFFQAISFLFSFSFSFLFEEKKNLIGILILTLNFAFKAGESKQVRRKW